MPRGIYERKQKEVSTETEVTAPVSQPTIVPNVPREKVRVRQYSTNKDHMGEGEPLCLNCSHRQDMHHLWNYHEGTVIGKNLQGDVIQMDKKWKTVRIEDGNRPCQHACLCKNYE